MEINKLNQYMFEDKHSSTQSYKPYTFNNQTSDLQTFQTQESDLKMIGYNENESNIKEIFLQKIHDLNINLQNYGFLTLGDLFNNSFKNVEQTIYVVNSLLVQRKIEIDQRNEIIQKQNRLDRDYQTALDSLENAEIKLKQFEKDKDCLLQRIKSLDQQLIDQKYTADQQIKKAQTDFHKIRNRENEFSSEFRRKDQEIKKLYDQINKFNKEKNMNVKNTTEITYLLENQNQFIFMANSEHEYSNIAGKSLKQTQMNIIHENQYLRENFLNFNQQLNEMLQIKKQQMAKHKNIQINEFKDQEDSNLQLFSLKDELLQQPLERNGKNAIEIVKNNLDRFREIMEQFDLQQVDLDINQDCESEMDKIKALKDLKQLINNYKTITNNQENMIQNIIGKVNITPNPNPNPSPTILLFNQNSNPLQEISCNTNQNSRILKDTEIDNVKNFLQEQKQYLENKRKELEVTKKLMTSTTKKIEEDRQQLAATKKEMEQDADNFKKNLIDMLNNTKSMLDDKELNDNLQ